VERVRRDLIEDAGVVDEVVVIDDDSTDDTARVAADAGARVVDAAGVLPEYGTEHGKGQAMWRGVHVTTGDVVAFCDADVRDFDPSFVLGLVGPLLARDDVAFVKGFYERPFDGRPGEGGRVTELMARPLISVFFPHLAGVNQPLAGECAARRETLEAIPFVGGYGVDLGLLIDVSARFGASSVAQCDLGERVHRNRPLAELSVQALAILQLVLGRGGLPDDAYAGFPTARLLRPGVDPVAVTFTERPPLAEVPSHRKTA
jgi:glucosyl-3-phosphoglycerate synthase